MLGSQMEQPNDSNTPQDSTLKASVKDGMAHAVMLGSGETYLTPFAVFLNGTSMQIGLLSSLPPLLGSLSQPLGVWLIENLFSRKSLIIFTALIQALVWIPIAFIPYFFGLRANSAYLLLLLVLIYQIAGSIHLPAWNSIMGDVVPVETRGSYFGYRNRLCGLATFLSLIAAGQLLNYLEKYGLASFGFSIIFIVACVAKVISVLLLSRYQDIRLKIQAQDRFSFLQFVLRTPKSNFARFVLFASTVNFAAYLAGPFFAIYLLKDVKISYFWYTLIIATATIAQFLTMQYWGKLSDQFGNRKIMTVCGMGITCVPLLWIFWDNVIFLVAIQVFSGMAWAGFNLAAANFMFDAVSPPKRSRCVAYQAIVNSFFVLAGALLGAYLAEKLPPTWPLAKGPFTPDSIFHRIFFLSAIIRASAMIIFLRMFKEVRAVEPIRSRDLVFRITGLRPLSGVTYSLVTGLLKSTNKRSNIP